MYVLFSTVKTLDAKEISRFNLIGNLFVRFVTKLNILDSFSISFRMENDDENWCDCVSCGNAVHVDDGAVVRGKVYHVECVSNMVLGDPKWSQAKIDAFVQDPAAYFTGYKKSIGVKDDKFLYFINFTTRPGIDLKKWRKRLAFEMSRKFINGFELAVEHEDTNAHAHVRLRSSKYIKPSQIFSTYIKAFGNIDCKKVLYDNGIFAYLQKEADIVYSSVSGGVLVAAVDEGDGKVEVAPER